MNYEYRRLIRIVKMSFKLLGTYHQVNVIIHVINIITCAKHNVYIVTCKKTHKLLLYIVRQYLKTEKSYNPSLTLTFKSQLHSRNSDGVVLMSISFHIIFINFH